MHYFDYAASTPLHPKAAEVYAHFAKHCYGNTTSLHEIGSEAKNIVDYCRKQFAEVLGVDAAGIYFTSGGTESNLLSIISLAKANQHKGKHIITTMGEHPSIDSAFEYLENDGFSITKIPFTKEGIVNLSLLESAITKDTILLSVQHSNPEIGTIQPLEIISSLAEAHGILLHSDCIQSFGKTTLKPIAQIVDSLTLSGHKVYGPKGIGITYIHPRNRISPVFPGLIHEAGFRGGTVNVPAIAALSEAVSQFETTFSDDNSFYEYRKAFVSKLLAYPNYFTIYSADHDNIQLPHIVGLRTIRTEGQLMMLELNRHGFAISTGSACQVGQLTTSKIMIALKVDPQQANEFIRISFGKSTTMTSVLELANQMIDIQQRLQATKTSSAVSMIK